MWGAMYLSGWLVGWLGLCFAALRIDERAR